MVKREFMAGDRVYHREYGIRGMINMIEDDGSLLILWDDSKYASSRYSPHAIGRLVKRNSTSAMPKNAITLTMTEFLTAWNTAQAKEGNRYFEANGLKFGMNTNPSFTRLADAMGFFKGENK